MPDAHTSVPPVYPVPGTRGAGQRETVMRRAKTQPYEWFHFGSSLHSFSTVSGAHWTNGANAFLAGIYDNAWATPWIPPASFGSNPSAQFCIRSSLPHTSAPAGLVSSYLPPNWDCRKLDHASANFAYQFEPDGMANAPLWRATPGQPFRTGETIKPWWIGWSRGQATTEAGQDTTLGFITRKQAAGVTGAIFGGGTLLSNVTTVNIPASSPTTGQTFTPGSTTHMARELDLPATNGAVGITYTHDASTPNYCLQLSSAASPTNYILCAGARWTNETSKYGICLTTLSLGGAKVGDFQANHSNSWETIKAMKGNRRCIVSFGLQVNSAYNNLKARDDANTANSYYHLLLTHVTNTIAQLNPDMIVLFSDGIRVDGTGAQDTEYSQMVGADKQIADLFPGLVHVVNSRRVMERMGYTNAGEKMMGYTYKNAWAASTAYSVGDVVGFGDGHNIRYFRCLVAHTSAAADKPETGENWLLVWRGHRQFLAGSDSLTVAPSDFVHSGGQGSWMKSQLDFGCLFSGFQSFAPIQRGRIR